MLSSLAVEVWIFSQADLQMIDSPQLACKGLLQSVFHDNKIMIFGFLL